MRIFRMNWDLICFIWLHTLLLSSNFSTVMTEIYRHTDEHPSKICTSYMTKRKGWVQCLQSTYLVMVSDSLALSSPQYNGSSVTKVTPGQDKTPKLARFTQSETSSENKFGTHLVFFLTKGEIFHLWWEKCGLTSIGCCSSTSSLSAQFLLTH